MHVLSAWIQFEARDAFYVSFHLSDSVSVSRIVFEGYEQIRIPLGTFNTMRFKPKVKRDMVDQPNQMTIWLSDDDNRTPILITSDMVVGSVRLELKLAIGLTQKHHQVFCAQVVFQLPVYLCIFAIKILELSTFIFGMP